MYTRVVYAPTPFNVCIIVNSKRMNYLSRIRSTKGQIYQDVSAA